MAHDVFISYSAQDKEVAETVCATLERHSIRCWIAPRDVRPGVDWGEAIIEAIRASKVMVLVLSYTANTSRHIRNEVDRAVSREIPVIPFRIENVTPQGALEFHLAATHWFDALTPPLEHHAERLAGTLKVLLEPHTKDRPLRRREDWSVDAALTTPQPSDTRSAPRRPFGQRTSGWLTQLQRRGSQLRIPTARWPALLLTLLFLAAALGVVIWWTAGEDAPAARLGSSPAELRPVRLTANPTERRVTSAAIAPDGKYVAYADDFGISLRALPTGETTLLSNTAGMHVLGWSADATRVRAVQSGVAQKAAAQKVEYWEVSVLGRLQRADAGAPSPDGSRSFLSPSVRELSVTDSQGRNRPVLLLEEGETLEWPTWTSDGDQIAFALLREGRPAGMQAVNVRDGRRTTLVERSNRILGVAALTGGRIIFASEEPPPRGNDVNLWEVSLTGAGEGKRGQPRRLTAWSDILLSHLSASTDGSRLTFLRWTTQGDVYVGDLRPGNTGMALPKRLTFDDRDDMPTAWLPGDRAVLFTSDRNGTTDIFSQELGQHAPEQLVGTADEESDPRVTPDGAWIIFAAQSAQSLEVVLKRVPVEGGVAEEILRTPHFTHHRCGDRARCILEERGARGTIVSELDPMSGRGRELFRKPFGTGAPAVSPDGERIAFLAGTTIRIVRLDGSTDREIPVQAVSELSSLDWTADGRGFFTTEVTLQKSRLLHVAENGSTQVLWSPPDTQVAWGVPSRDGRRLALRAVTVDRNVWLLEGM